MKHWRRTSSSGGGGSSPPPPPAPPQVTDVSNIGGGSIEVTFDQAVTWDGAGFGTFLVGGAWNGWNLQSAANKLQSTTFGGSGDSWSWSAADASLTPVPDPTQNGFVT